MAGRLLDSQPELAYEHAQAAVRHAGRVDVAREAAGLAAYRTGRWAEALRELRTVRRLNGSAEHLPIMADCERGLGRPERAVELARDPAASRLPAEIQVELAMVVAGARLDMGEPEGALVALSGPVVRSARGELAVRVMEVRADALQAAGNDLEAAEARATLPAEEEDVWVVDLDDEDGDDELDGDGDSEAPLDDEPEDDDSDGDDSEEGTDEHVDGGDLGAEVVEIEPEGDEPDAAHADEADAEVVTAEEDER